MSYATLAARAALRLMWENERGSAAQRAWVTSMLSLQEELVDTWSGNYEELPNRWRLDWMLGTARQAAEQIVRVDSNPFAGGLEHESIWVNVAQDVDERSNQIEWPSELELTNWARLVRPKIELATPQRVAFAAAYAILWWCSWRRRMDNAGYTLTPEGKA